MAAYYGIPDEVCSVDLGDPGQRLGFDPLSEVVDSDDGVFVLSLSFGKLADNVYAPFHKAAWNDDATQGRWRPSWNVRETLTLVALSRPVVGVSFHRRPEIALSKRFEREGPPSGVVPAEAFVNFAEDLGRLDAIEASEQWG